MDIKPYQIDINADIGEGAMNEASIMPLISSCNIACGGHTGTKESMLKVLQLAKKYNVAAGAHPSFPDKKHFGRIRLDMPRKDLLDSLKQQISTLMSLADRVGCEVRHLKPHGALYNLAAIDEYFSEIIIELILNINPNLRLYAPYQSVMAQLAANSSVQIIYEGFADRSYNDDLTLVNRSQHNAVIVNSEIICHRVFKMITQQKVETISGLTKPLKVSTVCVHGDTPNAIEILKQLYYFLISKNIQIESV